MVARRVVRNGIELGSVVIIAGALTADAIVRTVEVRGVLIALVPLLLLLGAIGAVRVVRPHRSSRRVARATYRRGVVATAVLAIVVLNVVGPRLHRSVEGGGAALVGGYFLAASGFAAFRLRDRAGMPAA